MGLGDQLTSAAQAAAQKVSTWFQTTRSPVPWEPKQPGGGGPDTARKVRMERALAAYNGTALDSLKVAANAPNPNIKVNRLRGIVWATVFWLYGTPPRLTLPLPDDAAADDADETPPDAVAPLGTSADAMAPAADNEHPLQATLDAMLRVNSWPTKLLDWGMDGAICGTKWLRFDPPCMDGPCDPMNPDPDMWPKVTVLNPLEWSIQADPFDREAIAAYVWEVDGQMDGQPVRLRKLILPDADNCGWLVLDQYRRGQTAAWVTLATNVWPYAWPPVLASPNLPLPHSLYGEPDLTDGLIHLNQARNLNLSNRQQTELLHGHPLDWLRGVGKTDLDRAVGGVLYLGPGSTGEVGRLQPPPLSPSGGDLGRELDESICEESSTPALVLGRALPTGDPSGVALRVATWPLITKTEMKRTLDEPMLVEAVRRLMELCGHGPANIVSVTWGELLPTDPLTERQVLQVDAALGLASRATLMEKAGYDPATELAALAREKAANQPPPLPGVAVGQVPGPDKQALLGIQMMTGGTADAAALPPAKPL